MSIASRSAARQPDLIFDVGMHRGQDTAFYLGKGFRVVAFEANPGLAELGRARFASELAEGRLTIVEGAIVDPDSPAAREGRVTFYLNQDKDIWGTVDPGWAQRNARLGTTSAPIEVATVDFSEALRVHGVPHYLKVDIEGVDRVCLEALEGSAAKPSYVSVESDKTSLAAIRGELELLSRLGFDAFKLVEQSSIHQRQSQPEPPREGRKSDMVFEYGCSGLFGAELPGRWLTADEALARYRWIERGYRLLGDEGWLRRARWPGAGFLRRRTRRALGGLLGVPVPGWYDTHARHRDVAS
jgi:FkbM family methyltransferase